MMGEGRSAEYKSGSVNDISDIRNRRKGNAVELRKQKRNERLLEKRFTPGEQLQKFLPATDLPKPKLEDLPVLVENLKSTDYNAVKMGATQIRRLLSSSKTAPPLNDVIRTGCVTKLVELMTHSDIQLKIESAWTLTNLASGSSEQTQTVVDAGSVPVFISLLGDENKSVAEQCMWALGNIAGDSAILRDLTLQHGILPPLIRLLTEAYDAYIQAENKDPDNKDLKDIFTMMRTCTWALSNLCRGKNPVPNLKTLIPVIPLLSKLVRVEDKLTLADACWACSFMSDLEGGPEAVLEYNIGARLVQLLVYPYSDVVCPALRAIGNVVAGTDTQTQTIINYGIMPLLLNLLSDEKANIRKEACWAISNITAGTKEQAQQVVHAGLIPPLLYNLNEDTDHRVRKEAAWAVANATHCGQDSVIHYLVEQGAIEGLSNFLSTANEQKTLSVILLALSKIMDAGARLPRAEGQNQFALILEECNGIGVIEGLKCHEHRKVYEAASKVLRYVCEDEDDFASVDDSNTYGFQFQAPDQQNNNTFNF